MPKRTDIRSILILGAGPIVIGQACEFDYSGAQACKALREEGFRVILVNSNPATIMTDPAMADATYIEPIEWRTVARIIEQEKPDALLPTMGGQTALNCALDLVREGVLEKHGVELIDITPTLHMFDETDQHFASGYYHWFFLIQPDNLPETLIGHDPVWYLNEKLRRASAPGFAFPDEVIDHYVRAGEWEQEEYDRRVTDWEINRGYERT